MNEIERLRQMRAELPPARPESRAGARGGLMARIEQEERSTRPHPRLSWRRPRLRLVAMGASLAALLIALPISILGGDGNVQPAVARVLDQVAEVAADQEPVTPGPGQFLYTRSKTAYLQAAGEWSVLVPSERQVWASFDGSRLGRVREVVGEPRFVSASQRASWVAAGSPPFRRANRVEDSPLSSGGFIDASDLPTDPAALRRLIEARVIPGVDGPPGEAETFGRIGDMLRETYLPSAIRAAIYQLTAELPRVELLGEVEDPAGRPGIGIAYTDRRWGVRHELIFDPATSALLGERQSIVESGAYGLEAPPGTPIGYAAYFESKVVNSVGRGAPAAAGSVNRSVGCYDRASLEADTTIVRGADPVAICSRLWREGVVDTRPHRPSPPLVACAEAGSPAVLVFPGPGPSVCRRLGLVAF